MGRPTSRKLAFFLKYSDIQKNRRPFGHRRRQFLKQFKFLISILKGRLQLFMISRQFHISSFLGAFYRRSVLSKNFHSDHHAYQLFDRSIHPNAVSFHRKNHQNWALDAFRLGFPDEGTIASALKSCNGDLVLGSQIHGFAVSSGFVSFTAVSNSLMNLYFKAGNFERAMDIFDTLSGPDIVSWNTVLSGLKGESAFDIALKMNHAGVVFDPTSYTTLLSYCLDLHGFLFGLQLHCRILKFGLVSDVFVGNTLITLYSRQDQLVDARNVFDEMPHRDLVSWGAIISGHTQEGNHGSQVIQFFLEMLRENTKPDHVSITGAISSSNSEGNHELGKQIHGFGIKTGYQKHVSVCNVLMSTYSKLKDTEGAKLVFRDMVERNVVSWTTMITIAEEEVVSLFNRMRLDRVYPNDVTFVNLLHAITNHGLINEGRATHGLCTKSSFTSEINVANCIISMYGKFGEMENARKMFDEVPLREIISWNALISGYALNERWQEAVETYFSASAVLHPNAYTFGSVLKSIGASESISIRNGQRCHSRLIKLGLNTDPVVSGSLLDMYAKRGSITESVRVFNETAIKSQFAWTAVISAHARHGDYDSAMRLFNQMEKEGVEPDSITFLSVLTACGRAGMVDQGRRFFDSMIQDHGIKPSSEHYSCMVDILGRAGLLDEAEELLNRTPGGPRLSGLQSLLGACRVHGNVVIAERVKDALTELEPMDSGSHVLMANLYADQGLWEKASGIWKEMRHKRVAKETGFSRVDFGGVDDSLSLHGFSSEDRSHPQFEDIFCMARWLGLGMQLLREPQGVVSPCKEDSDILD